MSNVDDIKSELEDKEKEVKELNDEIAKEEIKEKIDDARDVSILNFDSINFKLNSIIDNTEETKWQTKLEALANQHNQIISMISTLNSALESLSTLVASRVEQGQEPEPTKVSDEIKTEVSGASLEESPALITAPVLEKPSKTKGRARMV